MTHDGSDDMRDTHDTAMWEDPSESSALRQLLRAGQVEHSDYDVDRGLARHLAQLQAGAPLPAWAVQTTLQKSASWSILAWLLPPMISAGVVGAWLAIRPADPALVAALPPAAAALQEPQLTAAEPVAQVVAPSVQPALEAVANGLGNAAESQHLNPASEQGDRHEHHNGVARNARLATRANSVRRGRSARADEVGAGYGVAAQSTRDGSGISTSGISNSGGSKSNSDGDEPVALAPTKSAVTPTPAAANEPAPALVEDTKAKTERRAKADGESAKLDEVSGARLEREMRMLAVAQRVLTEDPARSLRLCRQGESEFRGSMFSAERKQVALLALVQLGQVDQARREGIPFLRAYPNAPWSARLREALSSGRLPSP